MSRLLFFIYVLVYVTSCYTFANDLRCQRDDQCEPNSCCYMSEQRYSTPSCRDMQGLGQVCRPNPVFLTDTTLSYPDGSQIKIEQVHLSICPCAANMTCSRKSGVCETI